jgi:hypothetical protein
MDFPLRPEVVTRSPFPLGAGLYLTSGPPAVGKTALLLGMSFWFKDKGVPYDYSYVCEPLAPRVAELMSPSGWTTWLKSKLVHPGRVVLVDSVTYTLRLLQQVTDLVPFLSNATYKEGLTPQDIIGVLLHDAMAVQARCALICTLNSSLFPAVDKLEGASFGKINVVSPSEFEVRDRLTRKSVRYIVPNEYISQAFETLGYNQRFESPAGMTRDLDVR